MYQKLILKNGARVLLMPSSETKAVTVLVLFKVGSRNETKKINGVSHFIEHLMFKGTKKRPTTLDISRDLDKVGAEYNAYTGKDHTGYYIKIDSEKIDMAVDILHDILYHSKFEASEIDRERTVIIEEINMYEDNPMMYLEDLFEELMYEGSPLGWHISGPRENIKKITRQEMIDYKNKYYSPKNMAIAIAGNIPDDILKKIDNCFGGVEKSKERIPATKMFQFSDKNFKQPKLKIHFKETEQAQLALGFPSFKISDPRVYALNLLSIILGGNMSSRLFVHIREKKGLAYFINCGLNKYEDTGNLMIRSGLDKSRIKEAIKAILLELKKIKQTGVTKSELEDAKDFLCGKTTLSLEDSSVLAAWFANQELLDKQILTPEEKFAEYYKVTLNDVKRAAREIIQEKYLRAVLIGPFKEDEEIQKLLQV